MTKVITYGTYDLLHFGHIRLLERAKALGDHLIVAVTADDFDKRRGKINVQQSLPQRIENVRATGLADEIIVEEYEGQKIDDILRYGVDIFTVGSDWVGKFDYLNEYCKVVYLPRTEGISSTELRSEKSALRLGLIGNAFGLKKIVKESSFVNGIEISKILLENGKDDGFSPSLKSEITDCFDSLAKQSDAVYIACHPSKRYSWCKRALEADLHVFCAAPIANSTEEFDDLYRIADSKNLTLMTALKTAYATAYYRLRLLVKSGIIGKIVSVDATCTTQSEYDHREPTELSDKWNCMSDWGTVAMLPIFQILGTQWSEKKIVSAFADPEEQFDIFSKIDFTYHGAVASLKVGRAVKSEGELVITGTEGYIYVPAPWWKTDYFEIRYENPLENKRNFYKLDGEGIRYELASFARVIRGGNPDSYLDRRVSRAITSVVQDFYSHKDLKTLEIDL